MKPGSVLCPPVLADAGSCRVGWWAFPSQSRRLHVSDQIALKDFLQRFARQEAVDLGPRGSAICA